MQPLSAALAPRLWGLDMGLLSSGTGQGEICLASWALFRMIIKLTPAHY